jgi:hypothetical protein
MRPEGVHVYVSEHHLESASGVPSWRTSSFSGGMGCVEVASAIGGGVAVRDSKDPDGGFLIYTAHEWRSFLAGVRNGEFDDLVPPVA